MNGLMVDGVIIKVALSRRQPNMGDAQGHHRRPGLGSRGEELFYVYTMKLKCNIKIRLSDDPIVWSFHVVDTVCSGPATAKNYITR